MADAEEGFSHKGGFTISEEKEKAVFLDRDGVINDNARPVNGPSDLVLLPGVGQAIKRLRDAGYRIFVVTNQGGVGLGYMTENDLRQVHAKMVRELARDGAVIDEIRYCAHKPQAGCGCRKPEPGMILDLAEKYNLDLAGSFIVGDGDSDIRAGRRVGMRTIFIGKNHADADAAAPNLPYAVDLILEGSAGKRHPGGNGGQSNGSGGGETPDFKEWIDDEGISHCKGFAGGGAGSGERVLRSANGKSKA